VRVFLSWSGDLSHSIAELLQEWLPSVIQTIEPFISTDSIEKGSRWGAQLSAGLSSSGFGLICLTQDNLQSPWMTFEAGALSEGLSSDRVCPLLVDVAPDQVRGPLAEFQATKIEKSDMFKLVAAMNRSSGEQSVDPARLGRLFEALWPEFESAVNAVLINHADQANSASKESISSRTFKLLAGRGTLINPSDESRNISFKVETINLLLNSVAKAFTERHGVEEARAVFERAGYEAALIFGERIHEKWGLEHPEDTLAERIDRWCTFDSDVGWGRLVSELKVDEDTDEISGVVRLLDNFQTYKRSEGEYPDCFLMHGYIRGVLESLTDGTPLTVECDQTQCPLRHRRKKDCAFMVSTQEND
jgi:predicted hydrocarbon binding protein